MTMLVAGCGGPHPAAGRDAAAPPAAEAAPGIGTPRAPLSTDEVTAFTRTLTLQDVTFRVSCPNRSSLNQLRIETEGLELDNSPWTQEVDGTVSGAEAADLNGDGSPEIYVFVTSAGSGSYGSLVAYAANNRKSLSSIYLPPITDDAAASKGYLGHDEFSIAGNRLVRRFPIYREGDANARPTGGTRRIEYRLEPGEAGWLLKPDRMTDQ